MPWDVLSVKQMDASDLPMFDWLVTMTLLLCLTGYLYCTEFHRLSKWHNLGCHVGLMASLFPPLEHAFVVSDGYGVRSIPFHPLPPVMIDWVPMRPWRHNLPHSGRTYLAWWLNILDAVKLLFGMCFICSQAWCWSSVPLGAMESGHKARTNVEDVFGHLALRVR